MKKQIAILLAFVLLLTVLAGCGAAAKDSASTMDNFTEYADTEEYYKSEDSAEWYNGSDEYGFAPAEPEVETPTSVSDGAVQEKTPDFSEKVIYTADVSMETTTFDETVKQVEKLVKQYSGFMESSNVEGIGYSASYYKSQTYRTARFTIRVPVKNYSALTEGFSDMGHVTRLSSYAENVTAQYTDMEAHITAYRTEEEALLKMMDKAEEVSDLIEIESRLADVRREIEYYTSTLRNLDNRIAYSTVNLSVNEVRELSEIVTPQLSYWEEMWQGFLASLKDVGSFFKNLFSGFVQALPVLILVAVILLIVILLFVKSIKKRKAKKAAKRQSAVGAAYAPVPPRNPEESRKE